MEPDGKTKLYYYRTNPTRVAEAYPNNEAWRKEHWIEGEEANEIFKRADYICVHCGYGENYKTKSGYKPKHKQLWSVHSPGQPAARFKIYQSDNSSETDCHNLVRKLERHAHKKGLTVLV